MFSNFVYLLFKVEFVFAAQTFLEVKKTLKS